MGWGKRRGNRGKQSFGRSSTTASNASSDDHASSKNDDTTTKTTTSSPKDKQQSSSKNKNNTNNNKPSTDNATATTIAATVANATTTPPDLVLTSEKRRGVYECDYCHSDISQLPRIRCAVCADFDLCLDCFATTDHAAAIARLKAAATTHSELQADGIASNMNMSTFGGAAVNHDDTHGYRVCDNTRYPLFFGLSASRHHHHHHNLQLQGLDKTKKDAAKTNGSTKSSNKDDAKSTATSMDVDEDEEEEDDDDDDDMENSDDGDVVNASTTTPTTTATTSTVKVMMVSDDPKSIWTAEEDLRLIDAIQTHGLGNWADISEAIGGNGSIGKTPKRCMERYFDDFLGRYGHILPAYTIVDDNHDDINKDNNNNNNNNNASTTEPTTPGASTPDKSNTGNDETTANDNDETSPTAPTPGEEDGAVRASKRQRSLTRMPSNASASSSRAGGDGSSGRSRKRFKVVPTETLPGYSDLWPEPYLPPIPGVTMGQQVARDLSTKNELAFVKATLAATTDEEVVQIREQYEQMQQKNPIGAPTVLPPLPDDAATLPGADLMGYMPRRGDFDIEWENEVESALADMEFTTADSEQDRQLKLQVLEIYYQKQEEREKRKKFILSRNLYDYRIYFHKQQQQEQQLPQDERDLVHRMRLFERFHTPQEHKQFIADIIKAKQLRKEIAKLQMYRRIGIRSLAEAEKYELDKSRRQFHKVAQMQKEAEAKSNNNNNSNSNPNNASSNNICNPKSNTAAAASTNTPATASVAASETSEMTSLAGATAGGGDLADSLWKQYRTSDRKARRSINRTGGDTTKTAATTTVNKEEDAKMTNPGKKEVTFETTTTKQEEKDVEKGDKAPTATAGDTKIQEADKQGDAVTSSDKNATKVGEDNKDGDEKNKKNDDSNNELDISEAKGYDLLSQREIALCTRLKLMPTQYLEIKKALIHESLTNGLLEGDNNNTNCSNRRMVYKIDVERRGDVLDFMVRAGWITTKLAQSARAAVTPLVSTTSAE